MDKENEERIKSKIRQIKNVDDKTLNLIASQLNAISSNPNVNIDEMISLLGAPKDDLDRQIKSIQDKRNMLKQNFKNTLAKV